MRIADFRSLTKKRVRLIEENHAIHALGLRKDSIEVLLGFADVLVDDGGEVHRVQVQPKLAGKHLSRHRLARARWPSEQGSQPAAARRRATHFPYIEDLLAITCAREQLLELLHRVGRQNQVGEANRGLDAAGQPLETGGILRPGPRLELLLV